MENPSKTLRHSLNLPVFITSTLVILLLVGYTVIFPDNSNHLFAEAKIWVMENASWFYVLAVALILIFCVFIMVSRYGDIKLGPDHSTPTYSYRTWFAMLFSTGMGIGLMFFGVAEPLMHFAHPPLGEGGTAEAAKEAMRITFFHWGLHAWAIYAVVGLILAYFAYRHNLPLTLRSALYPLIGDRIKGPIGHAVDIFAIVGTVFGVATSLGYGVLQVNAGLSELFNIPTGTKTQVILIIIISAMATVSVASGLDRGIKILSETNLWLAVLLMLFILIVGPTIFLLQTFVENVGGYLSDIVNKTFNLFAYQPREEWLGGWTLLYWGWWLSWSPFVGMFIARISRGRTIRQFIAGVLFVPAGFTLFWMTVFGDTAIHMVLYDNVQTLIEVVDKDSSLALFEFLKHFPFASAISTFAVVMVAIFFITSADSGALVIDMLASGGKDNTPLWQRIFWGVIIGIVAIALLMAGGLGALQTATIVSALPFSMILLASMWGLLKALRHDSTKIMLRHQSLTSTKPSSSQGGWQRRLRNMVLYSRRSHVTRFITEVVLIAYNEVTEELRKQGFTCEAKLTDKGEAQFEVDFGGEDNFVYMVRPSSYTQPNFTQEEGEEELDKEKKYFRAEVHLSEGGQDYDIMGWGRLEVIDDILNQYEKHMHFLHVVRDE